MRGVGRATALRLAGQGADIALTDIHRESRDLPPAEIRLDWRSIDSVAEEVSPWANAACRCIVTWVIAIK